MITHGTTPHDVLDGVNEYDGEPETLDVVDITKDGDTVTVEHVNREDDAEGLFGEGGVIAGHFMKANTHAAQQGRAGFQRGEYWAERLRIRARIPNVPDSPDVVEYELTAGDLRAAGEDELNELIAEQIAADMGML